jgi:outer membrane protein assembly factor BamB
MHSRPVLGICSVRRRSAALVVFSICCAFGIGAQASDWPQFLGPERNGTYRNPPLSRAWPAEGPAVVWQRPVGKGFSGPVVSQEHLILFQRVDDRAVIECLEARTGKQLWKAGYATDYRDDFGFDDGPRATPAIADGRVFTFGAEGRLSCWKLADGAAQWSIDTQKEFGSPKGYFGRAGSPLVDQNLVIVNVGGQGGAGIVAFDCGSGGIRWKATDDPASYASPVMAVIQGRRAVLSLTREALVALDPSAGRVLFRHPWRPSLSASVSAATPLVLGDLTFISACYGAGASLFQFKDGRPEVIWSGDDSLSNHYATSVEHGGFLYGWHGRQEQGCELRCVELRSGKVRWKEAGLKAGSVTLAGDELLVLTEKGLLLRAPATPNGFKPTARVQALPFEVRAFPALADGFLFARSKDRLFCFDLGRD